MENTVRNVNTRAIITFKNNKTFELPFVSSDEQANQLKTYGTGGRISERLYAQSSTNIVGNICSNTLSINIKSHDRKLIPSNEDSEFYGYMNDTATIDILCDTEYKTGINMGRYYVDTWESGLSHSTSTEVTITAVDLLSKIKNISLGKIRLLRNLDFNNYMKTIVDTLNDKLPDNMKILYTDEDLNIFKNSNYDWQMYYNNIDRDNVETIFNNIALSAICYIWIDRERHIKTDHLLDDEGSVEAVCSLSGSENLFSYELQSGDIDKYSGVTVNFIDSILYNDKQILEMREYELRRGRNKLSNIKLNSNKVSNIHHIRIECETGKAVCTYFSNYKDTIDLDIVATDKTKANITVFGTVVEEVTDSITQYKDDNNKNTVVEINNNILRKEYIDTYTNGLIQLMSFKNNKVIVDGWINPELQLSNIVTMTGARLNINDYYKVIGLEFTLGTNYRCKATLLRTTGIEPSINSLMYSDNQILMDLYDGYEIRPYRFSELTDYENGVVVNQLGETIEVLEGLL